MDWIAVSLGALAVVFVTLGIAYLDLVKLQKQHGVDLQLMRDLQIRHHNQTFSEMGDLRKENARLNKQAQELLEEKERLLEEKDLMPKWPPATIQPEWDDNKSD